MTTQPETLEALRQLVQDSRRLMQQPTLTPEERMTLEQTLAGLLAAERAVLLKKAATSANFLDTSERLKLIAKELRQIAQTQNQKAKALDQIQTLVRSASVLIYTVTEWI